MPFSLMYMYHAIFSAVYFCRAQIIDLDILNDWLIDNNSCLTLLHSGWPKLYRVLAVLSAIGLNFVAFHTNTYISHISLSYEIHSEMLPKFLRLCQTTSVQFQNHPFQHPYA